MTEDEKIWRLLSEFCESIGFRLDPLAPSHVDAADKFRVHMNVLFKRKKEQP